MECPVSEYCPSAVTSIEKIKKIKEEIAADSNHVKVEVEERQQDLKTATFSGGHEPALIKTEDSPLDW